MQIRDSVVVITGASSGIGHATALRLAKQGADLVLAARREQALDAVARECQEAGARCLIVPTDVADPVQIERLADRALGEFGRIDVWINDAAVTAFGPFDEIPSDVYRGVIETNLFGCIHGTRAALRRFRERGSGVIINLGSVTSHLPQPWASAYTVSKAGVLALDRCIRQELRLQGERDVHVVTILPSTIDTPLFDNAANYTGRRIVAMPPVNDPEQVARAIEGAIRRPRREITVGRASYTGGLLARLAPGAAERVMAKQVDRKHLAEPVARTTPGNVLAPGTVPGTVHGGWGGRRTSGASNVLTAGVALGLGALALWAGMRANRAMTYRSRTRRLPWSTALVAAGLGRRMVRSRRTPWAPEKALPGERRLLPWTSRRDRLPIEPEIPHLRG